ncbi:DNA adenine methylase [Ralstonia sp. 24A2]|uniref:DNA adenine methylase n=1 Tax=Ralstonia sp. 24A2 TaxID=3447364 RepID=UPI003F6A2A80
MHIDRALQIEVAPFLKWAGGKRWLASRIEDYFVGNYNTYLEPFLGSGAIFFKLRPNRAILSDVNFKLIETYEAIKGDYAKVAALLRDYHVAHSEDVYYRERQRKRKSIPAKAAQFIYLNRTCWNGLYRVNMKGEFNVPIGTKTNVVLDTDDWSAAAEALRHAQLIHCDFEETIDRATRGDLLFVDPPYTVKHNNNGFVKYNENIFAWADQVRLRDAVLRAKRRGAQVICTNADHPSIWELYGSDFDVQRVSRASVIAGAAQFRGKTTELVIR